MFSYKFFNKIKSTRYFNVFFKSVLKVQHRNFLKIFFNQIISTQRDEHIDSQLTKHTDSYQFPPTQPTRDRNSPEPTSYLSPASLSQVSTFRQYGDIDGSSGVRVNWYR